MTAHTEREGLRVQVADLQRQIVRLRAEHMAARDRALDEAATIAEDAAPVTQNWTSTQICGVCDRIAAAIRALKGAKP